VRNLLPLHVCVHRHKLQAVTPLPFRVVDEINQGMDIHNERAVIEVLQHISDLGESCTYAHHVPLLVVGYDTIAVQLGLETMRLGASYL
jgi:Fe-S cluster assembly ATPase SufC